MIVSLALSDTSTRWTVANTVEAFRYETCSGAKAENIIARICWWLSLDSCTSRLQTDWPGVPLEACYLLL